MHFSNERASSNNNYTHNRQMLLVFSFITVNFDLHSEMDGAFDKKTKKRKPLTVAVVHTQQSTLRYNTMHVVLG